VGREIDSPGSQFGLPQEHVINGIAEKKEGKAKIEGYKIVNNLKEWMGTLLCDGRSEGHKLTCAPRKGKTSYWTLR
jgi:hypothetical protein